MPKTIEPRLKLISNYLKLNSNEIFLIPEYQREYAWNQDQCDKLWQDICDYIESDNVDETGQKEPYFFGTIIADCSISNQISLIDGQQRTTTFILLLKALLIRLQEVLVVNHFDEDAKSLKNGLIARRDSILEILYRVEPEDRDDLLEHWEKVKGIKVLENLSINEQTEYKQELQRIIESQTYEDAVISRHENKYRKGDNRLTNFFKNFRYFYEKLKEYSQSDLNIFAKTLLKECQVIEIRSWNTEQAITMFNSLNSTGLPLTDENIISAQLYKYASLDRESFNQKWTSLKQLTERLGAQNGIKMDSILQQYMYIRRAKTKEYIKEGNQPDVTTPGLRRYYIVDNKRMLEQPFELCANLEKIAFTWNKIKDYPIVKLLQKFNDNTKIYLISYLFRYNVDEISEDKLIEVAECLIRLFTILELVEAGYSSASFKTFLFGENVKLVDTNVCEIIDDFNQHISSRWSRERIKETLQDYQKNVLVYLNEYLFAKSHGLYFDFDASVNIEHIMPASGKNIEAIRQDAGVETLEEFTGIVNSLGNKILLEEDINKSISNDWFRTKKQQTVRQKAGYKDSKYGIASALVNYHSDLWTKDDIEIAKDKAVERILNFIFS